MPKWTIGQKVEAINQLITGRILEICQNGSVVVETTDGFEMTFLPHEILALPSESFLKNSPPIIRKDKAPARKKSVKKVKGKVPPMEVDLHIEQLVKSTRHLSKYDILNLQVDTARRQLEFAIGKRLPEVVFIHGVGQGVLRAELEFLFGRYHNVTVSDADYAQYGLGALKVSIRTGVN